MYFVAFVLFYLFVMFKSFTFPTKLLDFVL